MLGLGVYIGPRCRVCTSGEHRLIGERVSRLTTQQAAEQIKSQEGAMRNIDCSCALGTLLILVGLACLKFA